MPDQLPLPLYLVAPATLTMLRTAPPEALQLFTSKGDADAFAARFPYTRRMELTTSAAVAEMLRTAPGEYTAATIRSGDEMARYELSELAKRCGESLTPDPAAGPSPWMSAHGSGRALLTRTAPAAAPPVTPPPRDPSPAAAPADDQLRKMREEFYRREVENS